MTDNIIIDLRKWRKWAFTALWIAVLAGLAANIWADIDLDRKDAQARLEMVQSILNKELIK